VKEFLTEFIKGLARWPLLLGAMLSFGLAVYEEMVTDNTEILIGVAGFAVGCILLGGWLVSYIVDGERRHYSERAPIWKHMEETSAPPAGGDGQDGAEGL
jgi:hypothetical protein